MYGYPAHSPEADLDLLRRILQMSSMGEQGVGLVMMRSMEEREVGVRKKTKTRRFVLQQQLLHVCSQEKERRLVRCYG